MRVRWGLVFVALFCLRAPAAARAQIPAVQPQSVPTPPAQTRQVTYDAAQAAFDRADWAAAASGFAQLLPSQADKPLSRSQAVIASRYAAALLHLERLDEAEAWANRSIPALPENDPATLALAWLTKADVERLGYDYQAALKDYDRAASYAAPLGFTDMIIRIRAGEAIAGATVDPDATRSRLAAFMTDPAFAGHANKQMLAQFEDFQARAAINAGDQTAASSLAAKALSDSGGLSDRLSLSQAAIRNDAGIIARLRGDDASTQRYFAYTGAGHLKDTNWAEQHTGDLPVCGEDVKPDDSVVVSLAIADDGHVAGAIPVYASRPGELGLTFARTIASWRWDPDAIKALNPFWRSTLQFGLRCVTRSRAEHLGQFTRQEVATWLVNHGLLAASTLSAHGVDYVLVVRSDDPRLFAPGGAVLAAAVGVEPKTTAQMEASWSALDATKAPPSAYAMLIDNWAIAQAKRGGFHGYYRLLADVLAAWETRFRQQFPNDRALSLLMLNEALAREYDGDFPGAEPILAAVVAQQSVGSQRIDTIRSVALLHQAISLDRMGDAKAAQVSLARSGLNQQMCFLSNARPVSRDRGANSEYYPDEAQRWSFEGFAQESFDVGDDGHAKDVRTVISYPPYIFDRAGERIVSHFTFVPSWLGGRAMGCEGDRQTIKFALGE